MLSRFDTPELLFTKAALREDAQKQSILRAQFMSEVRDRVRKDQEHEQVSLQVQIRKISMNMSLICSHTK